MKDGVPAPTWRRKTTLRGVRVHQELYQDAWTLADATVKGVSRGLYQGSLRFPISPRRLNLFKFLSGWGQRRFYRRCPTSAWEVLWLLGRKSLGRAFSLERDKGGSWLERLPWNCVCTAVCKILRGCQLISKDAGGGKGPSQTTSERGHGAEGVPVEERVTRSLQDPACLPPTAPHQASDHRASPNPHPRWPRWRGLFPCHCTRSGDDWQGWLESERVNRFYFPLFLALYE